MRSVLTFFSALTLLTGMTGCSKKGDLAFQCPACSKVFHVMTTCDSCKHAHVFKKSGVDDIPECSNCGKLVTVEVEHIPCGATARCDSKYCFIRDKSKG